MTEENTGKIEAETSQQSPSETEENTQKALTQEQVDKIVAERVARERSKFEKKYSGVDVDHYKSLVEQEESRKQEELEKRGQYETLLKEQAEKFNSKIKTYESELHSIKVDGTLLQEASKSKAVNPQQVVSLLKNSLRLNDAGGVDVVDASGQVRYDDNGDPLPVSKLVDEFLNANPHFRTAGPSGSGTQGAQGKNTSVKLELDQLDMKNPKHRDIYRQMMRDKGVRV
jgi:hypothetical protein